LDATDLVILTGNLSAMLLKNPPFALRHAQDERRKYETHDGFPFMLSFVEA